MRRGHPGIGGWRNENTRHFRPRSGGSSHFRPPRGYGLLDTPRFPPPGPRPLRPFNIRPGQLNIHNVQENHDRNIYRHNRQNNQRDKFQRPQRFNQPNHPRSRHCEDYNIPPPYCEAIDFYEDNTNNQYHVNSMGDIDQRQYGTNQKNQEQHSHHRFSPWANPPNEYNEIYNDDESLNNKYNRQENVDGNKLPLIEYTGHRPPASDHYGGNPSSAIDNSNSFSRSVDDTVDIIRKRLMNRNEPHQQKDSQINEPTQGDQTTAVRDNINVSSDYQNKQQPPAKKRIQRQRSTNSRKCEKIKDKIVHQLFKMDKDRIHKLMDNPSSSSKFEYAISSLITESQISLNRHLRSVAEKSLSSSSDFINNDTVYEDTFMKQMQCILEPQDTIFLEDIKPLVMAELSKVLQIDSICQTGSDQRYDVPEDSTNYYPVEENPNYESEYHDNTYNYGDLNEDPYYHERKLQSFEEFENSELNKDKDETRNYEYLPYEDEEYRLNTLFERRQSRKSSDQDQNNKSVEKQRMPRRSIDTKRSDEMYQNYNSTLPIRSRRSIDDKSCEGQNVKNESPLPIFDTNVEQFSEEEDPFAELDQQYHVAVDPNFIETYDVPSPHRSIETVTPPLINKIKTPDKYIKKELTELQSIGKSPLKLSSNENIELLPSYEIKKEVTTPIKATYSNENLSVSNINLKQEHTPQKNMDQELGKSENSSTLIKSSTPTATRKRTLDQRPAHRKEKRKKSDSSQPDSNKQILNKNIIINVNDCAAKKLEKCKEAKSIFNLFFSKGDHDKETVKESKKVESADKHYSDKYVKRKEEPKTLKTKKKDIVKKPHSNSSNHSNIFSKDNTSTTSNTTLKSDSKSKLKNIDMFVEQPRKVSVHQSHRNTTVLPPTTPEKILEDNKISKVHTNKKITKNESLKAHGIKKLISKETQTLASKACTTRFCQTEKKKFVEKAIQTEYVAFEKSGPKSNDAFERMKEIDLEIQALLQEKFKLYNSLESKDPTQSTMQTLGMTVVNMSPLEDAKENDITDSISISADAIVEDFTNLPVEELEQLALETAQVEQKEPMTIDKKKRRKKISEQEATIEGSPKRNVKKVKTPNISLIEQIITDDRPLEDIISLDDLESSPIRTRRKNTKQKVSKVQKKKVTKNVNISKPICNTQIQLKECSVVLVRFDVNKYLNNLNEENKYNEEVICQIIPSQIFESLVAQDEILVDDKEVNDVIEEEIVNDIHFDMLDVSEDIIIGDNYEVKSTEDKDSRDRVEVPISEEIILDNSQSSIEDIPNPEEGQGNGECKMYDYSTDEKLQRDSILVTGNADAILAIECVENNFLAAGLDGNVYHFGGDGQLITVLRGSNLAVTCLTIVKEKYETTVYTGSLDSRIRYYDLETGMEKGPECNVLSPIQTMDRAWDTIFVGTRTGFVLQFECKNNMLIPVSTVKFSEQSILALRAMKEGPRKVLLVAARSEDVTIKDAQTGLLLRTLVGPKMTVYTLLYEDGKIYCGTSSHQIHVFDYASGSHASVHEGGKGAVCLRASGGLLFAGCYDGCVYVYREGETRPRAQLRGPSLMLLSLAVLGTKIIAGYKDRSLYIWKIPLSILQEMIL
ncbi:LOW QUALITY PROTEIN: uncharacterized protein ACR2FA_003352 [Aphomia sociella]